MELLNELGIDRALLWPTLGSLLEERVHDNPPAIHAVVHSLNQWMKSTGRSTTRAACSRPRSSHLGSSTRRSRSSTGWWSGGEDHLDPALPGLGLEGPRRRPCPSSTPSGPRWRSPTSWSACTRRTAGTSATQRVGGGKDGEIPPFKGARASPPHRHAGRPIFDTIASLVGHGLSHVSLIALHAGRERLGLGAAALGRIEHAYHTAETSSTRTR